jgi:hypothetical protein
MPRSRTWGGQSQRVRPSAGPMTGSACPRLSRLSGSSVRPRGHGATRLCPACSLKTHRSMHRLDADATDESVERRFQWPLRQRHRRNRLHFTLQCQAKEPGVIEQARDVSSAASMADQRNGRSKERPIEGMTGKYLAGVTRRRRELRGPEFFASRTADDAARIIRALFPNFQCSDRVTCIGTESRHPGFSILSLADALRRRPRRHHRLHPHICAMSPG